MPSAWLIGSFVIKSEIVILIGSLIIGLLFFWLISPDCKQNTKKRMDELGNLLIVFVFSLWIGKILLNLSAFIQDPLSILAYPSDSNAFYIAVVLSIIYGKIKIARSYNDMVDFLYAWIIVFFTASITYVFIQMIIGTAGFSWQYLGLHVLLIIMYTLLQDKYSKEKLVFSGIVLWSLGQLILSDFSHTYIFQFLISFLFYALIFIGTIIFIMIRKKVKQ
ncbi:hypothetical protein SAMN04487944_115124 [Gracilibacillus ureilyticus]|uniref:Uncharacterized protein n=1 Tax=Gracilibacillus ureilyticus TaxID=531814 RepID=A0A1H9U1J2_9BACI|nr:hypothetical protein [Gracilibacillus ureilyticus]SES03148.1 hypothetical protein SAMN04487944_115124 [Gracilibacillus ureilyticus]